MIKRVCLPGSEWLYLKIYTGTKSAEKILREVVAPFADRLIADKAISEYFFIRYSDPGFHIRLRLRIIDKNSFNSVFENIGVYFGELSDSGVIHKIVVDTYMREVDRYGEAAMERSEALFCVDSRAIISLIRVLDGGIAEADKDRNRWLAAVVLIDDMLDAFGYSAESKLDISKQISDNFCREFGVTTPQYHKPINGKFREHRLAIVEMMERRGSLYSSLETVLGERKIEISKIAKELMGIEPASTEIVTNTIPSFIHMTMNRLFMKNNRMCEMVVYHLLSQYYTYLSKRITK